MKKVRSPYDKQGLDRKSRRLCDKCRKTGWFKQEQRTCPRLERNALGRTGFLCGGALSPVRRQPRPAEKGGDVIRAAIAAAREVDPAIAPIADKIRGAARVKLAHAEKKLAEAMTDLKRTVTRIDTWQRKVAYHSRRASISNAEVGAERAKKARPKEEEELDADVLPDVDGPPLV